MESKNRMASQRASLFAAVAVVAGSWIPVGAQAPEPAVTVLPPRALILPSVSWQNGTLTAQETGIESAGFRWPTLAETNPQPTMVQRPASGPPAAPAMAMPAATTQSAWLSAPPGSASGGELSAQPPAMPAPAAAMPQPFPQMPPSAVSGPWAPQPVPRVPSSAPAWRWYGYGAINLTEKTTVNDPPNASRPAPTPRPLTSSANTIPAPPMPTPYTEEPQTPAAASPLSQGEPIWRSPSARDAVQTVQYQAPAFRPTGTSNPMQSGPAPQPVMTVPPPAPLPPAAPPPANLPPLPWNAPMARATNAGMATVPASFAAPPGAPGARPAAVPARSTAVPPAPPSIEDTLGRLKTSIERACGPAVSRVELYARSAGSLLVKLRISRPEDAEVLANRISKLPELAPYQVLFEVQVSR